MEKVESQRDAAAFHSVLYIVSPVRLLLYRTEILFGEEGGGSRPPSFHGLPVRQELHGGMQ
jgi:hypothetical protein